MSVPLAGPAAPDPGARGEVVPFRLGDLSGEIVDGALPPGVALEPELRRVLDPGAALATLHWGRNYLYRVDWPAGAGPCSETVPVVVKQFRGDSLKARLRRRLRGSKGERSFRAALRLLELGVLTPEPMLFAESSDPAGPSFYLCAQRDDLLEARYLLRAVAAGHAADSFPDVDIASVLRRAGRMVRRLHEGEVWHRDMTSGNLLLDRRSFGPGSPLPPIEDPDPGLWLLDLNRARLGRPLSLSERMRELCRMPIHDARLRRAYLDGYFESREGAGARIPRARAERLYETYRKAFLLRNRSKEGVRSTGRRLRDLILPRRSAHVHIPRAERGASSRDKTVWDPLSHQPFQHAGRLEKLKVRLADAGAHAAALVSASKGLAAVPTFRQLRRELYREPTPFDGLGVGVAADLGPDPEPTLEAIAGLGISKVLLRPHPWQPELTAPDLLARELAQRGVELTLALPQSRELVRDPDRWRAAVAELAERFLPYARHVQIGQAVNRSKWGVWKPAEYVRLFLAAAEALRAVRSDVELLGPGVIDFEPHATAAYLNLPEPGLRFDALASLLYVDRRGAPENRQLGFDLVGKVLLLRALAEAGRNCPSGRCWITEMNWPLREGPHSPAGRDVAVDEEQQASYLVRYALLALGTGLVERVFWWQLAARGYGLVDPLAANGGGAFRRRPAFAALRQLQSRLAGAQHLGPWIETPAPVRLHRFRVDDEEVWVGWTMGAPCSVAVPGTVTRREDRDGGELVGAGDRVELVDAPRYFWVRRT